MPGSSRRGSNLLFYTRISRRARPRASVKFIILLYDASWGLHIMQRAAVHDSVYAATSDYSLLPHADVVVFHVPTAPDPSCVRKYPGQKWVAYSLESDVYNPQQRDPGYIAHFDFTMTYHWDSDVPLMYWWPASTAQLLRPPVEKTEQADAVSFCSNATEKSGRTVYL